MPDKNQLLLPIIANLKKLSFTGSFFIPGKNLFPKNRMICNFRKPPDSPDFSQAPFKSDG